jgi:hypothetical protein
VSGLSDRHADAERAKRERCVEYWREHVQEGRARERALKGRLTKIREALVWARKYGQKFDHLSDCMVFAEFRDGRPCDCGYEDIVGFGSLDDVIDELLVEP